VNYEAMETFKLMRTKKANHTETIFSNDFKNQKQTNIENPTLQEPKVVKS
jgi:hypothetical protein